MRARIPAGTPAAIRVIRNLRLGSMAEKPPYARAIPRRTGRYFLEPLPMLYSPLSSKSCLVLSITGWIWRFHTRFVSLEFCHRVGTEPAAPRGDEPGHRT